MSSGEPKSLTFWIPCRRNRKRQRRELSRPDPWSRLHSNVSFSFHTPQILIRPEFDRNHTPYICL